MSEDRAHQAAEPQAAHSHAPAAEPAGPQAEAAPDGAALAPEVLSNPALSGRGNTAVRIATLQRMQQLYGNTAVQRYLQGQARAAENPAAPATDPSQADSALAALPVRGPAVVQRSLTGSFPTKLGGFEMGMETQTGALAGTGPSGLKGKIQFVPGPALPYSNKIGLIQIVKLQDNKGADVNPVSLPTTTGPHVRTKEDKAAGVEGGFFTDVLHNDPFITKKAKGPGDPLPPYYPFSSGGGQIFGFKRSDDQADQKAAELFDFPGTSSKTAELSFSFETVAKGDDTQQTYGRVKWSFGLSKGNVVNEAMSVDDSESATFTEALDKHRDFYVHEPVTFYFGFNQDQPESGEADKIDEFLDYLRRFPDVRLDLTGFADQRGNADYNRKLALRRANNLKTVLVARGVAADRINAPTAEGATTKFTGDATTDQDKEANRRGNRRVTLTFVHTASILPP